MPTSDEQQTLQQTNHKFTFLNNQIPSGNIHLKPSDNLTHNLFLGSLANQASTPVINLSTLQLFDLANALDEYSTDVVALPNLSEQKVLNFPKWATVAVVLGFAAGLTPLTMQLARNQQKTQTAQEIAADTEEKIYLQPTPSLQLSVSPNPGLASSDSLLPGLSSITPQSPNPSVSTSTLPKYNSAVQVPANPQLGLPTTNLPPQGQVAIPTPGNSAQVPTNKPNSARTRIASSSQNKQPNLNTSTSKINSIISSRKSTFNQPPTPPQTSITRAIINLTSKSPATKDKEKNASNSAVNRLRQGRNLSSQKTATTTLFDTFQVAEARSFITKRWQPPNSLTTALEYSLLVGADGTIERIEPLNKAARDYVDRSGLPLIDFPFCFS
ncbi:FIG00873927: hypothetical protein [Richelia intracellularis]|nr:FIG00873927: hypothetical protein [Richelia intracellularis]